MDFLCRAKTIGLYSEKECDDFIEKVLKKHSILPVKRMIDYDCAKKQVLNRK